MHRCRLQMINVPETPDPNALSWRCRPLQLRTLEHGQSFNIFRVHSVVASCDKAVQHVPVLFKICGFSSSQDSRVLLAQPTQESDI
jgi:hypothetical protein